MSCKVRPAEVAGGIWTFSLILSRNFHVISLINRIINSLNAMSSLTIYFDVKFSVFARLRN